MGGDIRLREAGIQRGDLLGHAGLVFAPERPGEWGVEGRLVFLHRDRLVRQVVALLQQAVSGSRVRPAKLAKGIEGGEQAEAEAEQQDDAQPVRNNTEDAEPGGGEIECCQREDGQQQRQKLLEKQHALRGQALCRNQPCEGRPQGKCTLLVAAGAVLQSGLRDLAFRAGVTGKGRFRRLPGNSHCGKDNILCGEGEGKRLRMPVFPARSPKSDCYPQSSQAGTLSSAISSS
jgi:hypothetical protein